jgi:hypothetical protein
VPDERTACSFDGWPASRAAAVYDDAGARQPSRPGLGLGNLKKARREQPPGKKGIR